MKDPRVDSLIDLLFVHFTCECDADMMEGLRGIRDETDVPQEIEVSEGRTINWRVNDAVALKREHWGHSRGIRGSKGKVYKVNPKTLKIKFECRTGFMRVPHNMVEVFQEV